MPAHYPKEPTMDQHTPAYLAVRGAARFLTLTTLMGAFFLIPTTLVAVLTSWL